MRLMAVLEAFVYDPLINWRLLRSDEKGDKPDAKPPKGADMIANINAEPPHVALSNSDHAHVLSSSISAQQSRASRKSRVTIFFCNTFLINSILF